MMIFIVSLLVNYLQSPAQPLFKFRRHMGLGLIPKLVLNLRQNVAVYRESCV